MLRSSFLRISLIVIGFWLAMNALNAQQTTIDKIDKKYLNWHNKDPKADKVMGISLEKAREGILKDRKTVKTVVVAVIDGGVDIDHEDMAGKIWINAGEIPGNGIDDDNNVYVDDVHGWNYIGNSKGENILYENYEYTRIVKMNNKNHPSYKAAKAQYDKELKKRREEKKDLENFEKIYNGAKEYILSATGIDVRNADDLKKVKSKDPNVKIAYKFLKERYEMGFTEEILERLKKTNAEYLDYFLNMEYNPRTITGDDPTNLEDRNYGNNDVKGPRSDHGTSVAGVIAAVVGNGIGIDGIATDVKIMVLRTTPRGDERDKDIALAIKYAVDNKADIINMSFGKDYSPEKEFIDWAVRYAQQHNVLLIHSAGNSSKNIDREASFPSDRYLDGSEIPNWMNIGASDMKANKTLPAYFTNYGRKHVDIFAPGVDVVSLNTDNTYEPVSGTSIAGPVVAGVAALILSYYPDIKPEEMIDILMKSAYRPKKPKKVFLPGSRGKGAEKVAFAELSKSGGIVNVYNALLLAEQRFGSKN